MDEDRTTKKSLQCPANWHTKKKQAKSTNQRKMDGLVKELLVLRTENWRTLAEKRLAFGKGFLRRPRPTLGCRATEDGRKEGNFSIYTSCVTQKTETKCAAGKEWSWQQLFW
ncbi:hypothetical protein TNCV_2065001 [Trichonephila clavipes]|nr:hypothetical protein TNCV_2065001 [Trichonephila clavipes]